MNKTTVIIRTHNEEKSITNTLATLYSQIFKGSFEVIIVDSGSTDGTLNVAKEWQNRLKIRILHWDKPFQYGQTLNWGIQNAESEFVISLSAHCPPLHSGWLTALISPFEGNHVAGVYGRQVPFPGINPFDESTQYLYFPERPLSFNIENQDELKLCKFSNANGAIRRSVWEKHKFNDTLPFAEDALWANNVILDNWSIVYEPEGAVYHSHPIKISNAFNVARRSACAFNRIEKNNKLYIHNNSRSIHDILRNDLVALWRNKKLYQVLLWMPYRISQYLGILFGHSDYFTNKNANI